MKKAFTLLELVFVIVIIGIMIGVGSSALKPKYLQNDTNFIVAKIIETQFMGIGYEHNSFGCQEINPDYKSGCIRIEKDALSEDATNTNELNYKLHISIEPLDTTICFDSKGRPHEGDFTQSTLLKAQKKLTFKYLDKEKNIFIEPLTGFVLDN